jgi:hypothetical protein
LQLTLAERTSLCSSETPTGSLLRDRTLRLFTCILRPAEQSLAFDRLASSVNKGSFSFCS